MSRRPLPLVVAGALLLLLGLTFGTESVRLGLWSEGMPGAGLLPLVSAGLLVGLVLVLVLLGLPVPEEEYALSTRPIVAVGLLLVYAWVVPLAGFVPATILMITLWTHFFHEQGWLRSVVLAVVLVAAGVTLFGTALSVPMPLFPSAP